MGRQYSPVPIQYSTAMANLQRYMSAAWIGADQDPEFRLQMQRALKCTDRDGSVSGPSVERPWGKQNSLVWDTFYGTGNIAYLQNEIKKRGYQPPKRDDLIPFMSRALERNAPYGVYDSFLNCNMESQSLQYVRDIVNYANADVLREVLTMLNVHAWANDTYLTDIAYFRGCFAMERPIDVNFGQQRHGGQIYSDYFLPDSQPNAY